MNGSGLFIGPPNLARLRNFVVKPTARPSVPDKFCIGFGKIRRVYLRLSLNYQLDMTTAALPIPKALGPASSRRCGAPVAQHSARPAARLLYGGLRHTGARIQWYDLPPGVRHIPLDPLECFTAVLCLNLAGTGSIRSADTLLELKTGTVTLFFTGPGPLQAIRKSGEKHQFLTVEFSASYLRQQLAPCDGALHPAVEAFIGGHSAPTMSGESWQLTGQQEAVARRMKEPPVFQRARDLWYEGQVLQVMAEYLFARRNQDELFCDRQKRLGRERSQKVIAILERDLSDPPGLEVIGREVGCSPFHLSRTFSQQTGMTIPQYLRKLRIERAAELLRSGGHNVTEAALEVGYSSVSHFSQAFCQITGCCPGLYPVKSQLSANK